MPIRYFSSNKGIFGSADLEQRISDGAINTVGLAEAIITGQAPDGGLYMPTMIPQIGKRELQRLRTAPYPHVFVSTMKRFFEGVLSTNTLERIAAEAYNFNPFIEQIGDNDYLERLDEGPTGAFKDYAAQVLYRIMEALITEPPKTETEFRRALKSLELITFVTATSGDTGSASGVGILGRPNMWMAILHSSFIPEHVSDLQAKQMDTLGQNVYVIRVNTDFDGCAKIASDLFKDPDLQRMNLASANSINIGRLLPQITPFFYSYLKVAQGPEEVYFSVPLGNVGHAVAGMIAKMMGLPIKLILGVNENDVVERAIRTGIYAPADRTHPSPSNSMNVNWPSNFRRATNFYGGQLIEGKDPDDPERRIVELWKAPDLSRMRQDMRAYRISDEETSRIIERFYDQNHQIGDLHSTIEPHGAVALGAAQRFRQETGYSGKIITIETAHPGKFPERLRDKGIEPELPDCLARIADAPHGRYYTASNYGEVKQLLKSLYDLEIMRQASNLAAKN